MRTATLFPETSVVPVPLGGPLTVAALAPVSCQAKGARGAAGVAVPIAPKVTPAPKPGTQCARLLALLQDGKWHSNFQLAEGVYGPRPCGRLGARIYDLQQLGYKIDRARDAEVFGETVERARYWYRLAPVNLGAARRDPTCPECGYRSGHAANCILYGAA